MTLLAVSFRMTTDVWYVDSKDKKTWCYGSRRVSPNWFNLEPLLVSELAVGDYVSGSGWMVWPQNPDGSPVSGLAEEFGRMGPHTMYMVEAVEDGLAHSVLSS